MRSAFASRVPLVIAPRVIALLVIAGCTGSDAGSVDDSAVPKSTPVTASPTTESPVVAEGTAESRPADDDRAESVRITVEAAGSAVELTGTVAESDDPFGQFVSCSGLRKTFGTYSVLASAPVGEIRSIGVASNDLVDAPGVHDASVRVEFATESAIDAIGTITVAEDYRSGSFVAFGSDGERIDGDFECNGAAPPEPLAAVAKESARAVEIIALLRSGEAQRLVGLVATDEDAATVVCPGTSQAAADDPSIVRVVGDGSLGAITAFELAGGDAPILRLVVGAMTYEFDDVVLGESNDVAAGSFGAESADVAIDGAFRCS